MREQIQFLLDGANVRRYHTLTTIVQETVGHHSHGVALLACMLSPTSPSTDLIFAALVHDLAEHQVGDIPAPSKRQFGIGEQISALEERLLESSGWAPGMLTSDELRTLKLADIAQGALYCVEELQRGNSRMRVVLDRYLSYATAMILVGVEKKLFDEIERMGNECK